MQYEGGERCSTCGHVLQQVSVAAEEKSAWPTQILPGFLYLGGFDHASRSDLLKAMDISHILSVSEKHSRERRTALSGVVSLLSGLKLKSDVLAV